MFGPIRLPLNRTIHSYQIELSAGPSHYLYSRRKGEAVEQKKLLGRGGSFFLEPVEPVHLNLKISKTLMIELADSVIVMPGVSQQVFLTFPIEMMLTWREGKRVVEVDTFSALPRKLALYGDPNQGLLCHYWKSAAQFVPPEVDMAIEGVLSLTVQNFTERPIDMRKGVFLAEGMKLYYDKRGVSMAAMMLIKESGVAETVFLEKPARPGMTRSHEMVSAGGLLSGHGRFVMEYGL